MEIARCILEPRHAIEQRPAVGMERRGEQPVDWRLLHQPPAVEDHGPAADLAHQIEIVRDEQEREPQPLAQVRQQPHDLRLHRHVECRRRLVRDQQLWPAGDGHGDQHALPHAAGELVRKLVEPRTGIADAHEVEQLDRPVARLGHAHAGMGTDHIGQMNTDRKHGVQSGQGILEDDGQRPAAQPPHGRLVELGQVRPVEDDPPPRDPARMAQQAHDRERRLALAGAAFAHEADSLPRVHAEVDAAHHFHDPPADREADPEVLDLQQRHSDHHPAGAGDLAGIENVAERIAEQIEADDGQRDGETREEVGPVFAEKSERLASASMPPQLGRGGSTPSPTKLSELRRRCRRRSAASPVRLPARGSSAARRPT